MLWRLDFHTTSFAEIGRELSLSFGSKKTSRNHTSCAIPPESSLNFCILDPLPCCCGTAFSAPLASSNTMVRSYRPTNCFRSICTHQVHQKGNIATFPSNPKSRRISTSHTLLIPTFLPKRKCKNFANYPISLPTN